MTFLTPTIRSMLGIFFLAGSLVKSCTAIGSLQVNTTVGMSYGLINGTTPHVVQFLGIPYAEPPVGSLRWAAPVMKSPEDSIDAARFSPSCPQFADSGPDVYTVDVPEFNINNPTSEDCLTINVWSPLTPATDYTEKLPVLVWMFGGGFQNGGLDVEYQIPSQWVERTQSHIVVALK
jgi:acetylcholinesterase